MSKLNIFIGILEEKTTFNWRFSVKQVSVVNKYLGVGCIETFVFKYKYVIYLTINDTF
jgi:hypothetical protein